MTGLMLKDMYSLRTYFLKQLALMTVLYLAISVGLMKNFSFLSPMLTMSVVMMLISSFSVDEASSWDSYALTLPVTPRAIVGAKYLLLRRSAGCGRYRICPVRRAGQFTYRNGFLEIAASTGGVIVVYILSPCSCCRCF
ncbi:MAG: ABC-2 transporter permease [Ruthenibacterium lactatiformans]